MSNMNASLIVTGDASGVVTAGKQAETALQGIINKSTGVTRQTALNTKETRFYKQALDQNTQSLNQLRNAYDPTYAASQRLKVGQDVLRNSMKLGNITVKEHDALLTALQTEYTRTVAAQMKMVAATGSVKKSFGAAGGVQNFSYQLQDIFTQVGMGVPLMISLGQQAPQLLSGFGQVGAILGVVAAAAFPLGAAIFGLGYQSKEAKKEVESFEDRLVSAANSIAQATSSVRGATLDDMKAIKEAYNDVSVQVLALVKDMNDALVKTEMSKAESLLGEFFGSTALDDLQEAARARDEFIRETEMRISAVQSQIEANIAVDFNTQELDFLQEELRGLLAFEGIAIDFEVDPDTSAKILDLKTEIEAAVAAGNVDQLAPAVAELRELMKTIPDGPLKDMADGLLPIEDLIRRAIALTENNVKTTQELSDTASGVSFDGAIASASALNNQIAQAVGNMLKLQNAGIDSLKEAQIRYDYRDDAVGQAGALAGARFDSQTSAIPEGGFTNAGEEAFYNSQRQQSINTAQEIARLNKARTDALKANSGGGGSSSRGGSSRKDNQAQRTEAEISKLRDTYETDLRAAEQWRIKSLENLDPARAGYEQFAEDVESIYQDRLSEAYRKDLDRRTDWASGVERVLLDAEDNLRSWADVSEDIFSAWSEAGEDAFVELAMTGKASMKDLVDYTLEQMLRMAYQQSVQPAINGVFDFFTGAIGNLFGGGSAAPSATVAKSHTGSQIGRSSVNRTYGPGARLGRNERVTITEVGQKVFSPRQMDNGAAVVNALAMAAQQPSGNAGMFVEINNYGSNKVEAKQTENGRMTIDILEQVEGKIAGNVAKGQGPLHRVLTSQMGVKKTFGSGQR